MSLQFGIFGIGQFGTNVANYASKKGWKSVVANTAELDLRSASDVSSDCIIHLGGNGAGRNRDIGMKAAVDNAKRIMVKCEEEFANCDAVFVAASCGGGTGSGALPVILEILTGIHEYVGAIICLPDNLESPKAKMNTLECFEQLSDFPSLGSVFIIDNEKARLLNPGVCKKTLYKLTNEETVNYLNELNALTDTESYVSNFDPSDLLGIIKERGYTMISKVIFENASIDNKFKLAKRIRESWKGNYQPDFCDDQIVKGALLGKTPEEVSAQIEINVIFQETEIPYDFNDVYFYPDKGNEAQEKGVSKFYTILSGLSFPNQRLNEISESIKNVEDKIIDNISKSRNQKFSSEKWISKINEKVEQPQRISDRIKEKGKPNLMDRIKKYIK